MLWNLKDNKLHKSFGVKLSLKGNYIASTFTLNNNIVWQFKTNDGKLILVIRFKHLGHTNVLNNEHYFVWME